MRFVTFLFSRSLTCGTTWHAAGLLGKLRSSAAETKLSSYSVELYSKLEGDTGVGTGWEIIFQSFISFSDFVSQECAPI